jgi:drug/metabolite transporter (DMT)-like permease
MALRVGIGALVLWPLMAWRIGHLPLLQQPVALLVCGLLNSALPFVLFGWALQTLTAGYSALLNATAPLWGALVAAVWLGDRPSRKQLFGLAVAFLGVLGLVAIRGGLGVRGDGLAIALALIATLSYGLAGSFNKRYLLATPPLVVAAGSQMGATLLLVGPAAVFWPGEPVSFKAWASVVALGVLCTGLAYILFFRLIARVGPARAMTVTFLVPLFGVLWGFLVLGETLTLPMLIAGGVVVLGTAWASSSAAPARKPD